MSISAVSLYMCIHTQREEGRKTSNPIKMSLIPVINPTHFGSPPSPPNSKTSLYLLTQLADLNRRLPAEAVLLPAKPGPLRPREVPPPPRPSPHTITLQTPAFRNLRLPKRLRVVYFLARTRLAQRIIMVRGTEGQKLGRADRDLVAAS